MPSAASSQARSPVILSLTLAVLVGIFHFMRRISSLQRNLIAQEAEMRHMALHDALTGLPNRVNFVRQARTAIAGATEQAPIYIGLFDLDRFKLVNDTFGHDVGDRLIVETGRRAAGALGSGDVLARLGGDEYALILRSAASDSEALAQMKGRGRGNCQGLRRRSGRHSAQRQHRPVARRPSRCPARRSPEDGRPRALQGQEQRAGTCAAVRGPAQPAPGARGASARTCQALTGRNS